MYIIRCDNDILYAPRYVGSSHAVSEATLTLGVNKAGSLEFTMPYGNIKHSSVNLLASDISVEQDGKVLFKGRPIDSNQDFERNRTITCEGPLAFLNDGIVRPYDYSSGIKIGQYFNWLLTTYSSNASSNRKVYPGTFTHSDPDMLLYIQRDDYSNTLSELQDTLIDAIGGYLITRYASDGKIYIDYFEEITKKANQEIVFARNLLNLENYIDASEVFTTIIPLGKKGSDGKPITIASVNSGRDWIENQEATARYGHISRVIEWNDVDDPATLKKLGEASLSNAVKMAISITASAFDLHLVNVNTDALEYGTMVQITSPPHGLQHEELLLSDIELDLLDGGNSEYTLGVEGATISSAAAKPSKK